MPGIELVGVVSASGVSAAHAARRFGFRYAASDETQVLNDPAIDTVAILTRHNLHARQVVAALAAGKHVFCEKPLAINSEELDEIIAAIKGIGDRGVGDKLLTPHSSLLTFSPLLTVGYNRRFAPLAQKLQAFVADRKEPLVAHYRVNAGYIPPFHWVHDPQIGGGRIIGEGCHFVDFLTFLVGSLPVEVEGHALPDAGRYHQDNVVLTFTFSDGSLGTLTYLANGDKAFPKERVEVFASGRVGVLDDFRSLAFVRGGRQDIQRTPLRQDKGHAAAWSAFLAAVSAGGPPPIPYNQLFGVTAATFAAVQALCSGERVTIPAGW
jgi:predicted dehydrogenase